MHFLLLTHLIAVRSYVFRAKHDVSEDTEVFQGEALGKSPDGYVLLLVHLYFRLFRMILGSKTSQIWEFQSLMRLLFFHSSYIVLIFYFGRQGLSTYKELCALASDLNQPDLVYKFMNLANHHAMWNSRKVSRINPNVIVYDLVTYGVEPFSIACNDRWLFLYCREQHLGLTLLQPKQVSSWLLSCLSWFPVSIDTSLTPTWPLGRPWLASGMLSSQIKPL